MAAQTKVRKCACGCGTTILRGQWVTGHDHRAVHQRIKKHHGDVAGFIDWYDRTLREQRPRTNRKVA
jgi:hypothetical protein